MVSQRGRVGESFATKLARERSFTSVYSQMFQEVGSLGVALVAGIALEGFGITMLLSCVINRDSYCHHWDRTPLSIELQRR